MSCPDPRLWTKAVKRRLSNGFRTLAVAGVLGVALLAVGGMGASEPAPNEPPKATTVAPAPAAPAAPAAVPTPVNPASPATANSPPAGRESTATETSADLRLREGTRLVDEPGFFRTTGDRVTFFTKEGDNRLVGLENLALQRVAAVLGQQPEKRLWKVTGTITEYRGENFLFVDRAILESWEGYQAGLQESTP